MAVDLQDIVEIVRVQLGASAVGIQDRLVEDLRAESVDIVGIAVAIEDKYAISIDEAELADIGTVNDLALLVGMRVGTG